METIDGAHAANAISYVLDKEKARKENKPVFLTSNNIELNPLTGKPYSPVEVLMDMQLKLAASKHRVENPFWRIELCPPKEECRDWTMGQWSAGSVRIIATLPRARAASAAAAATTRGGW